MYSNRTKLPTEASQGGWQNPINIHIPRILGMRNCEEIIVCRQSKLAKSSCASVMKMDKNCLIYDEAKIEVYSPTTLSNKFNHITNGNHSGEIRFLTWNKGNCHLENKLEAIKIMIDENRPHVFSIHKAQARQIH